VRLVSTKNGGKIEHLKPKANIYFEIAVIDEKPLYSCSCRGKDGRSPCPNDLRADVPRVQHDSNRAKD